MKFQSKSDYLTKRDVPDILRGINMFRPLFTSLAKVKLTHDMLTEEEILSAYQCVDIKFKFSGLV